MKFLHNKNYRKEIVKVFSNCQELDVAVAFFGLDSIELFRKSKDKKIRVICNLESGACNPYLIEKIHKHKNVIIKTNPKLHAKTLIQKNSAIIGSANISSNGLSLEDNELSGWLETGVLTTSKSIISESKSWFNETWGSSVTVKTTDIEKYKALWRERRNSRISKNSSLSIIEASRTNSSTFKDRKIYFAVYRDDNPSDEAYEAFESAKAVHSNLSEHLDFYEEWSDLPEDSYLISIYVGPRLGARVDGINKTHHRKLIEEFSNSSGETGEIILCFKEENILGHKLTMKDKKFIKDNIKKLINSEFADESDGFLVPLSEGIAILEKAFNK